jgi:hypothetical protein
MTTGPSTPSILPSSPRNGFAVVAGGAALLRGVSKDERHRGLMVRDGAPDSTSALPGERLLTMRVNERRQPPDAQQSVVQPPAQFLERKHDVLAKRGALLQRAVPAIDLRQSRPIDLQFEIAVQRGAGGDVGERQRVAQ